MSKRIIFGPRSSGNLDHTGGIVVLFELYIDFLNNNNDDFIVVDTNRKNYKSKLAYLISMYKWLFRTLEFSLIELHVTARDILILVVPLQLFVRSSSKVVVRKFAGNFDDWLHQQLSIVKWLILCAIKKVDLLFFETKYLIDTFKKKGIDAEWWPNVRKYQTQFDISMRHSYKGRLLFLSQIKRSKGIVDAITCLEGLPDHYSLNVFGPLVEPDLLELFDSNNRIRYYGIVSPDDVQKIMREYDLLLFPSRHSGEGYPGVVIEAKAVGLPVVCYDHGGLSEIVEYGKDGFTVTKGDVQNLISCILGITSESYSSLSRQALDSFKDFDADKIHVKITNQIYRLSDQF